jgi:hypothetical protein
MEMDPLDEFLLGEPRDEFDGDLHDLLPPLLFFKVKRTLVTFERGDSTTRFCSLLKRAERAPGEALRGGLAKVVPFRRGGAPEGQGSPP